MPSQTVQFPEVGTADAPSKNGNLVAGEFRAPAADEWLDVRDPSSGDVVLRVPAMLPEEVEAAYDAAAAGLPAWRDAGPIFRGRILAEAAAILRDRAEEIARSVSVEMGKTLAEASGEVQRSAAFFDYYAGLARTACGEVLPDERPGVSSWTLDEPVGIVLAITPWNDPLLTPARKLAPALLAGNAVVLKPASETPLAALILAAVLDEAGVPAGAINTVTGRTGAIADQLLDDPRLAAVTFTGSTAVGLDLERRLAGRSVRLEVEMGGKNAAVVMPDADLELAARTVAAAAFGQGGQRCTATSRLLVHEDIATPFVDRLVEIAAEMRVGPGLEPTSEIGPLVSEGHLESVLGAVERAVGDGAEYLLEGGRVDDPACERGSFLAPIVVGADRSAAIWSEELFGPVLAVSRFGSLEEAVGAVNTSEYGLSAGIFTRDLDVAAHFVKAVEVGQVAVNLPTSGWDVHQPFGGWKESGSAFKEHGVEGLRFYTRVKTVAQGPNQEGA